MEDYRKIYEDKCHIKIPKGYEIHHIDFDRNNNDIRNLVMLPKEAHQQYHKCIEELEKFDIQKVITSVLDNGNGINRMNSYYYTKFIKVYEECCKYADYRDFLLGLLPNIHRIFKEEIWKK